MTDIRVKKIPGLTAPFWNLGDHFLRFDEAQTLTPSEQVLVWASLGGVPTGNLPPNVEALAELTGAANLLPYFTGAGSMALTDFTGFGRDLLARVNAEGLAEDIGAQPAGDYQPHDDDLTAIAALATTAFGRALLTMANGAATYGALGQIPNAQVRNDLPPDKAFRRGNILGTVSQTGGVPTGALMESGSNANGNYVRFANGLQICWKGNFDLTAPTASAASAFWTFPANFAASIVPRGILVSGAGASYVGITSTTIGAPYSTPSTNISSGSTMGVFSNPPGSFTIGGQILDTLVWAFGRWF